MSFDAESCCWGVGVGVAAVLVPVPPVVPVEPVDPVVPVTPAELFQAAGRAGDDARAAQVTILAARREEADGAGGAVAEDVARHGEEG